MVQPIRLTRRICPQLLKNIKQQLENTDNSAQDLLRFEPVEHDLPPLRAVDRPRLPTLRESTSSHTDDSSGSGGITWKQGRLGLYYSQNLPLMIVVKLQSKA